MVKKKEQKKGTVKIATPEYDSGRETKVLLEAIRDEVKIVAQEHGSIMEKLEKHDQRFDRIETALMENSVQIKKLEKGQIRLEEGQIRLEERQIKLEEGQIKLEEGQIKLEEGQIKLEERHIKLEEGQIRIEQKLDTAIDNHEKRITKIEEKVGV